MEIDNEETLDEINLDELRPTPTLSGHRWRQRGTQLICTTCPFTHSTYIPPNQRMVGIDDNGLPKLEKITY